jgi:hypothetical protein
MFSAGALCNLRNTLKSVAKFDVKMRGGHKIAAVISELCMPFA